MVKFRVYLYLLFCPLFVANSATFKDYLNKRRDQVSKDSERIQKNKIITPQDKAYLKTAGAGIEPVKELPPKPASAKMPAPYFDSEGNPLNPPSKEEVSDMKEALRVGGTKGAQMIKKKIDAKVEKEKPANGKVPNTLTVTEPKKETKQPTVQKYKTNQPKVTPASEPQKTSIQIDRSQVPNEMVFPKKE